MEQQVPSSSQPGTVVEHLGHTTFVVEYGSFRLWIDPLIARRDLDLRTPAYAEWQQRTSPRANAILISHGHDDHLHPPSLLGFPVETPIYFLDEDPSTCSCREAPRPLLAQLGFRDLRPFRPGERLRLVEGFHVDAVPADASSEGEEQVGFLVETPDVVMLDAVDIQDGPQTREALAARRGRVDVAFVPTGASLQWEGYWNQADTVEAAQLCRWLEPALVGTCGGSVSLSARPRLDALERYPKDVADWLATAREHEAAPQLFARRPPFKLHYERRRLVRWSVAASTPMVPAGDAVPRALLACALTGYDPRRPTRRGGASLETLNDWLRALEATREVLAASRVGLEALLRRCGPQVNSLPAALLAPCTLRHLLRNDAIGTAARLCTLCPPPADDPSAIEVAFFEHAASLLEEDERAPARRLEYRVALAVDREVFRLSRVHATLRAWTLAEEPARKLRERHIERLRASFRSRRPLLGPHQFRVGREWAALAVGDPLPEGRAGVLVFASPGGVQRLVLSDLEWMFLDLCDGRTAGEIVEGARTALRVPEQDVEQALFELLARLSRASVVLVDWSA